MEKTTGRLEAFSDGIFGVAITLLALEIGFKEYEGATNANFWIEIKKRWPEYFTYFNSFATVLLIWMGHHRIFNQLKSSNHWIILLNGLVLFFVVLFPYPTKLVGAFIGTGAQDAAVSFYAGFTGFITLSMYLLNLCIVKTTCLLANPQKSLPWFKNMMRGQLIGFALYEAAAVLAYYSSITALSITFIMWVYWGISSKDEKESAE